MGLDSLMSQLENGDSSAGGAGAGVPMVRPGDASVAAPFTSRWVIATNNYIHNNHIIIAIATQGTVYSRRC